MCLSERGFVICLVGCVLAAAGSAAAQDVGGDESAGSADVSAETTTEPPPSPQRADAERRYAIAVERADAGDCQLAIAEFEEIYRLLENPVVFFNMSVCYEELHRYDDAMASYQRYLDEEVPDANERGEVERSLRRLEGFLGSVQVSANVAASVWIDDREVGQSPGQFRVPAGSHLVELRASGHESAQQEVVVASGRTVEVTLSLDKLAEEYGGLSPGFFWASSALAVVSLGATIALGVKALGAQSDYDDMQPVFESAPLAAERQRIRRLTITTDVLIGATAVFATAAIIFGLVADWSEDDGEAGTASVRLSPAVSRQSAGLLLNGTF